MCTFLPKQLVHLIDPSSDNLIFLIEFQDQSSCRDCLTNPFKVLHKQSNLYTQQCQLLLQILINTQFYKMISQIRQYQRPPKDKSDRFSKKQKVFLNSCELIIEEFSIKQKGFVYFVWRKGKKLAQSLKFACSQEAILIKQSLGLSLKTYVLDGIVQKRFTHLSVFDVNGRQIDSIKLDISQWTSQFTQKNISIGSCKLKLRVKKKQGVELDNFYQGRSQIQQSSQQEDFTVKNTKIIQKKQQWSIKEELAKARKQMQDFDFLTNKLKNDRTYLIAENEQLRNKLSQIHQHYGQQINKVKTHYEKRMQIRQSIYQQQIQQILTLFNSNYEINTEIMKNLITEQYQYEIQIRKLQEEHQHYIEKQEENYESVIADYQQSKRQMDNQIKQNLATIVQKENRITELTQELAITNEKLKSTQEQLQHQIQSHQSNKEQLQNIIAEKQKQIFTHLDDLESKKITIDTKDFQLKQHQEVIKQLTTTLNQQRQQKVKLDQQLVQLQAINHNLQVQIQKLHAEVNEKQNQYEFQKTMNEQLKDQIKLKQEDFVNQLKNLEQVYAEKQQLYINQAKIEHDKFMVQNKQIYELNMKIQQVQNEKALLDQHILMAKNDITQLHQMNQTLTQQIKLNSQSFSKQFNQQTERIGDLISQNSVLQAQNISLKEELSDTQKKLVQQTNSLKRDYDDLVNSKVKLYQDQIQFMKKQRHADIDNFQQLKSEYEKEISQLISRNNQESEDLQKMYREQNELKNKEYLELTQRLNTMTAAYQDLKTRLDLNQNHNNNFGRGGRRNIKDQLQIQEVDEEDSQSEQDSSDIDSQESSSAVKKKKKGKNKGKNKKKDKEKQKNKKGKKKKKVSSSEEQSESEQDSEQSSVQIDDTQKQDFQPILQQNQIKTKKQESPKLNKQTENPLLKHQDSHNTHTQKELLSQKKKKKISQSRISEDQKSHKSGKSQARKLQKQIKNLKKQIKNYQRNETVYLGQIQQLEEQVKSLNTQIDNLVKKIAKKDPKLGRSLSKDIENKREEKSDKSISKASQKSMKIPPPTPRKEVENMKMELEYLKRTNEQKNKAIGALQLQKIQLKKKMQSMEQMKSQYDKKLAMSQSKVLEIQKNQFGFGQQKVNEDGQLKKSIAILQNKFMSEKQKTQQIKLQKNKIAFQKEQIQNQYKRLKIRYEDLQNQIKKSEPSSTMKQMQKETEENNKKIMELSKTLNSVKLQRDSFEEQVRVLKKRYGEIIKNTQEWETKATNYQRQIQDLRRSQNKAKRDAQDYIGDIKKYKQQIKQLQQDMNNLTSVNTQTVYQRKRILDDIAKLQDSISNKDYEILKLSKQTQKLKQKIQENEDVKLGKRNQLLVDRQRLDGLVIKAQKRIQQLEQESRILKSKVELLQRQNKKNLQQKKQTYGQKLKFYVQQISNIKQIVDEYQAQNSRLKIQNSQFFQHNQILKLSFEKLQMKYEQVVDSQEKLINELNSLKAQIGQIKNQIQKKQTDIESLQSTINNLRKQLDSQRGMSKKKSDKLQAYQELNEKYIYQIKNLKIKLSQFETNVSENQLLSQKCQQSTKTIQELENQLKKLQEEYNNVINVYVYRKQDVEQAMRQLKEHQEKIKEEQITRVIEQLDNTHSQKQASMEQEIIELFNQNSKLRLNLQQKSQENSQYLIQLAQLEHFPQKCKNMQKQKQQRDRTIIQLTQDLKATNQQLRRAEAKLNQSIRSQEGKAMQNVINSKKCQDLQKKYKQLNQMYNELKKQQKKLLQKLKQINESKDKQTQKFSIESQSRQNKILALELQVNRYRENQTNMNKQYNRKIKKLEEKIQQISQTFKQHEKTLEDHYKSEIKRLSEALQKCSEQLQEKLSRIEELNQGLIMIQGQNDELVAELTNTRLQVSQQGEIYTNQINNLRNQMRETEEVYDTNIRNLQEQLSNMSKQLTTLRYNRQSNSRLSGSGVGGDQKNSKRYEEKIRLKDKKIQELKSNLFMMEETISRLMKKENNVQNLSLAQIQKLRISIDQNQRQNEQLKERIKIQTYNSNQIIKNLKKELFEQKNKTEETYLQLQEKILEIQSLTCELRTTKELYKELQKELQKRKTYLNSQIQEESALQAQLRIKNTKIKQLTEKYEETFSQKNKIDMELNRKNNELKKINQKMVSYTVNESEYKNSLQKKQNQINNLKTTLNEIQSTKDKQMFQNKKIKNQFGLLQKQVQNLKSELDFNKDSINQMIKTIQTQTKKIGESDAVVQKYIRLNEKAYEELGVSLEECIGIIVQTIHEKQQQINQILEELQKMQFALQRKNAQNQQLRRHKYQQSIKAQDLQFADQQLDSLRKVCDRLQQQKKQAIFRQQALKIQLQNLIQNEGRTQVTQKIQNILNGQYDVY